MVVEIAEQNDVCVLRMRGRLAVSTDVEYLHRRADEIKSMNCQKVLADLREVSFIDSTAIGFLVNLYTSVTKNPEARFVLTGANERVQHVLSLTRLDTVIPLVPNYQDALRSFGAVMPRT